MNVPCVTADSEVPAPADESWCIKRDSPLYPIRSRPARHDSAVPGASTWPGRLVFEYRYVDGTSGWRDHQLIEWLWRRVEQRTPLGTRRPRARGRERTGAGRQARQSEQAHASRDDPPPEGCECAHRPRTAHRGRQPSWHSYTDEEGTSVPLPEATAVPPVPPTPVSLDSPAGGAVKSGIRCSAALAIRSLLWV